MSNRNKAMSNRNTAVSNRKTAARYPARHVLHVALLVATTATLSGCRTTPLFNVMGSFFPAWMVCLAAGILLTVLARWFFQRVDFERHLRPLVLIYPALVAFFTCTLWLLMFS